MTHDDDPISIPEHASMSEPQTSFMSELTALINRYSKENGSNTPDFILAEYLAGALKLFDEVTNQRNTWGRIPSCCDNGCSCGVSKTCQGHC